jgi:hypothetical protein
VVRVVHNDDEVSYDDDVPLQRRMRAASIDGSVIDGPRWRLLDHDLTHQQRMRGPAAARLQATRRRQQGSLQRKRLWMQTQ